MCRCDVSADEYLKRLASLGYRSNKIGRKTPAVVGSSLVAANESLFFPRYPLDILSPYPLLGRCERVVVLLADDHSRALLYGVRCPRCLPTNVRDRNVISSFQNDTA